MEANKKVIVTQVKNGVVMKYETTAGTLRIENDIVQFTNSDGKRIILSQGNFVIEYPDGR